MTSYFDSKVYLQWKESLASEVNSNPTIEKVQSLDTMTVKQSFQNELMNTFSEKNPANKQFFP